MSSVAHALHPQGVVRFRAHDLDRGERAPVESGSLAAGRLVCCEAADARADEPNILVIMSDDVGVDNVSELQRE